MNKHQLCITDKGLAAAINLVAAGHLLARNTDCEELEQLQDCGGFSQNLQRDAVGRAFSQGNPRWGWSTRTFSSCCEMGSFILCCSTSRRPATSWSAP